MDLDLVEGIIRPKFMGGVGVAHENLLSANWPFGKKAGKIMPTLD